MKPNYHLKHTYQQLTESMRQFLLKDTRPGGRSGRRTRLFSMLVLLSEASAEERNLALRQNFGLGERGCISGDQLYLRALISILLRFPSICIYPKLNRTLRRIPVDEKLALTWFVE